MSVFSDVIDPLVDESRAVLSDNAHDYVDYFTATYIGCLSKRTNTRRPAKIKAERWSQYHNLMADKPHTNNSVEGFNSAWNSSSTMNSNVWATIDHFRKEETLAVARWREEMAMVQQRSPIASDSGTKRSIKQRNKVV